MSPFQPLSKHDASRIALAEILTTAREALRAGNVYGWDEGGPLGDALLGIKDCAETVLLHGIVSESSREKFGSQQGESSPMKVIFNVVSEFVEELREEARDPDVIAGRVVRLTVLYQSVRELPPLQSVTVVAGAVVRSTLLELRCYCGDTMTGGPRWKDDNQVKQKVRKTMDWLKAEAVQLQLTVRKGMYSA